MLPLGQPVTVGIIGVAREALLQVRQHPFQVNLPLQGAALIEDELVQMVLRAQLEFDFKLRAEGT